MATKILKGINFPGLEDTYVLQPVTVDAELSETSENPVQNKAIVAAMLQMKEEILEEVATALPSAEGVGF